MNGQWGWNQPPSPLSSIVFFFPSFSFLLPCLPSNSEAIGMSYGFSLLGLLGD